MQTVDLVEAQDMHVFIPVSIPIYIKCKPNPIKRVTSKYVKISFSPTFGGKTSVTVKNGQKT